MKRILTITAILLVFTLSSKATINPISNPFGEPYFKDGGIYSSSLILDSEGSDQWLWFTASLESNSVDYTMYIRVWMYYDGYHDNNCILNRPYCFGWRWSYQTFAYHVPAGTNQISGVIHVMQSGEQVNANNWYISAYTPN